MTAAGGTTTTKMISNVGAYPLYEIKNSSWDSTETITIPVTGEYALPIAAESQIIIVGALNETTEAQAADGTLTVSFDETNRRFTGTEAGAADDVLRILFYVVA